MSRPTARTTRSTRIEGPRRRPALAVASHRAHQPRLRELLAALAVAICALAWALPGTGLQAAESPEAAFEGVRQAVENKDFKSMVEHIAPSERVMMAFGLDMGVDMAVSFWEGADGEAAQKTYKALRERYGVSEDKDAGPELQITSDTPQEEIDAHIERRAEKIYDGVDVPGYVSELLDFFIALPMMEGEQVFPTESLTGLQIDGDRATAKAGEAEIEFIREGGEWYLAAPM